MGKVTGRLKLQERKPVTVQGRDCCCPQALQSLYRSPAGCKRAAASAFPLGFCCRAPLSSLATSRLANHLALRTSPALLLISSPFFPGPGEETNHSIKCWLLVAKDRVPKQQGCCHAFKQRQQPYALIYPDKRAAQILAL